MNFCPFLALLFGRRNRAIWPRVFQTVGLRRSIMTDMKVFGAAMFAAALLAGCGTLAGAAVGGAAGAAIGNNTGDGDAERGAAIGAAAGAIAGTVVDDD
jgi:hypothetical protein